MAATLISKVSAEFSKRESQADQILFELAKTNRAISPDERRFLTATGRLDQTGYRGDQQLRGLIHKAKTVLELRAAAGIDGEYEQAIEHRDSVSITNESIQGQLSAIDVQVQKLQQQSASIRAASQAACRAVDLMETARFELRSDRYIPSSVFDDFSAAKREIGEGIKRELLNSESQLAECRLAIEIDDHDIKQRTDKTCAHSQRSRTVIDFAASKGCVNQTIDNAKMIRREIDGERWSKFIAGKRRELPELQEHVDGLREQYVAAKETSNEILDFWLNENPWESRPLLNVILGV